jgi:hypothetical protein
MDSSFSPKDEIWFLRMCYHIWNAVYLRTPRRRVLLLQKVTGFQPIKWFPAFYGTRRIITAFTSARHLSLSWASSIQCIHSSPTSWISILILSSHLRLVLPNVFFPTDFSTKTLYKTLLYSLRATCPAHLILDFITRTAFCEQYQSFSSTLCSFLHSPVTSSLLGPNILLRTLFPNTLSLRSSVNVGDQVSHSYKTREREFYFCIYYY